MPVPAITSPRHSPHHRSGTGLKDQRWLPREQGAVLDVAPDLTAVLGLV